MNAANDITLVISRSGMEISWRYAWASFLAQVTIQRYFPLPAAVCAFLMAAVVTQLPTGRNWRVYQKLLLQFIGFIPIALLVVHQLQYQAMPFFSLDWMEHLLLGTKSISQWFILILMLLCLWLIWRGGQILVKSSRGYNSVCMHFDKGLGLFFLLMTIKAIVESRAGIYLHDRDFILPAIAYFVFSLTSVSIARNQSNVQKSFLAGRRGIGVILSISTLVTLLGTGTILLVYPYLYNVADSLLVVIKDIARPVEPVLVKILLFMFRPRGRDLNQKQHSDDPNLSGMGDSPKLTDIDTREVEGWEALLYQIMGWGLFAIIGIVFLGVVVCLLIFILRRLLKRSRDETTQLMPTGWISNLLRKFAALPLLMRHAWTSLLKGKDCAAMVYTGMLRWGRWSGMILLNSETPKEYGNRLVDRLRRAGAD